MTDNILVVIDEQNPYYEVLKAHYEVRNSEDAIASFETYDFIIDLTPSRTQKKYFYIKELARTTKAKVITDLSLCWGEWIYKNSPFVVGAVSTLFYSPTNFCEYSLRDNENEQVKNIILEFYKTINKSGTLISQHELAFHYPRTISMIINEAYFSLEEKLATKNDIDLAMKNGVNYPLGPIEWGEKIGLSTIIELLRELREVTGEERYKISHQLKLEAIKL